MSGGKYIVVFKNTASKEAIDKQAKQIHENGGTVGQEFNSVIMKGFSAQITDTYLLAMQSNLSAADNEIDYIEPDSVVTTQAWKSARYLCDIYSTTVVPYIWSVAKLLTNCMLLYRI